MRNFARKLIAWHRQLLLIIGLLFALEVILVYSITPKPPDKRSISHAFQTPAACLMTLTSPADIKEDGRIGLAVRGIGWLLSFSGWLLVPSMIGYVVSMRQGEEQSALGLAHQIELEAKKRGVSDENARAWAQMLFDVMEKHKEEK